MISFGPTLLRWNAEKNSRQMPWKGETDPYKIWISEIILQQTRVEQGLNYYKNFIKIFPDIHSLAKAPEEKIYKLWEGLGYYSRCKNLILTARYLSTEKKGNFPDNYDEILKLQGIGPYTAAAIGSFAFNLPYAVVDGNVVRVLSRIFGIYKSINTAEGKNFFSELALSLLDKTKPGLYNQAIMDFGAVICKPVGPLCSECPFKKYCIAFLSDKINDLPIKQQRIPIRKRWFYYVVLEDKNLVGIRQRLAKDIWQNLFEFFLIELGGKQTIKSLFMNLEKQFGLNKKEYEVLSISPIYSQQLSHQFISGQFLRIRLLKKLKPDIELTWIPSEKIKHFAFPRFINQFLQRTIPDA